MAKGKNQSRKPNWIIILTAAVLIAVVLIWSPWTPAEAMSPGTSTSAAKIPAEISVEEAFQLVEDGAFLLDVRTQEEWDDFHAPQAELIPLDELSSRLDELPTDGLIVTICRSGNRSASARDFLFEAGFDQVTSSAGGMNAWQAAGFPVE